MTRSILVVDDEPVLLHNVVQALRRAGFTVEGAGSVAEALAALRRGDFGLLCLDVHLGGDDGLDLLEFVRERWPQLPVIVMTGQDSLRNRNRAEALDAQAFLAKPFALSRLRELVRCLLDDPAATAAQASTPGRPLSVMTYSHDSIGLGHTRRNTNVAAGLERRIDGVSVLMMVGCPSGVVFDLPPGVDFIKLPSGCATSSTTRPGCASAGATSASARSSRATTTRCSSTASARSTTPSASTASTTGHPAARASAATSPATRISASGRRCAASWAARAARSWWSPPAAATTPSR